MEMGKVVNVIGATGLVGRELVNQLLENEGIEKVRIFVRRDFGKEHPKLEQHLIDFSDTESWSTFLKGDVLFSTLGTTLKQAGSKDNQYLVDYTWQYNFAREAAANGIPAYILVSSTGANSKSMIFYSRIKGKLDEEVQKLPFQKIVILRPSILAGIREKRRPMEEKSIRIMGNISKWLFKKYRPVEAATVAKAMVQSALGDITISGKIVHPEDIFTLAGQ
jgi:uncharacterized protein YbjT (DUF2867 family)